MTQSTVTALGARLRSEIIPFVVKPGRYLGLEWTGRSEYADHSDERTAVSILAPDTYERCVNDPFIVAIRESLAKCGCFEVSVSYPIAEDLSDKLNEAGLPLFAAPGLQAVSHSEVVIAPLKNPSDLLAILRLCKLTGLNPVKNQRDSSQKLIAVCPNKYYPPVYAEFFDAIYTLTASKANSDFDPKSVEKALQRESLAVIPEQPPCSALEVAINQARFAFLDSSQASVESLAQHISAGALNSGLTEWRLENCKSLASHFPGEIVAQVNLTLPHWVNGIALDGLRLTQVTPILISALKRYQRARVEIELNSLSQSCDPAFNCDNLCATLRELYSTSDAHVRLNVTLGHSSDSHTEIAETREALVQVARVVDRRRGLRITFSRPTGVPGTKELWRALPTVSEVEERFARITDGLRLRGVTCGLQNQTDSVFTDLLYRHALSKEDVFSFAESPNTPIEFSEAHLNSLTKDSWTDQSVIECYSKLWGGFKSVTDHSQNGANETRDHAEINYNSLNAQQSQSSAFGRSRKRVAAQTIAAPTRGRVRFTWERRGDARFLGHLDNIRTIESALLRMRAPVTFTQGKRPRLKISFGPPLPLGFTSECELFDGYFETNISPDFAAELNANLPTGFRVTDANAVYTKEDSISEAVQAAEYIVELPDLETFASVDEVMERDSLEFTRHTKSGPKTIDLRRGVFRAAPLSNSDSSFRHAEINSELALSLTLALTDSFYVRPEEFLIAAGIVTREQAPAILIHRRRFLFETPKFQSANRIVSGAHKS